MIELTVKTLDSKNHAFSVPDDVTVKQFKEHIADTVNISVDSQRLIYCGRVLQDEKNLSEYDVNGKVVHLVQRAPPGNNGNGPDRGPSGARSTTGTSGTRRTQQWRSLFGPGGNTGNAMYLGAMAFPAEIMDASGISMQQPRQCLSQSRLAVVQNMLRRASAILNRLENPPQESSDISPENGSAPTEAASEEEALSVSAPIPTVEITTGSFIIGNQQIDVGAPNMEVQSEVVPETAPTASETEPQPASTSSQQSPQNENEEDGNNGSSRYPRTRALAELLDQASEINTRVQPFMSQYQQLMRDDPVFSDRAAVATNQRLFTSVSGIMHNLAHAYHALSDIICDFSQPPPRNLRCRPVLIHHSAVVQTGIPIQVTGNLTANITGQQTGSTVILNGTSTSATSDTAERPASAEATSGSEESVIQAPADSQSSEEPTESQTQAAEQAPADGTTATAGAADESSPRQPRSPSISPPRVTRIGPVGSGGPGFEFIVDVAPGSITIDSVEATVVTNASPNTTESNQTWQNPPEFVQNLITALAGQFMGATLQQYRLPEQQNAGTNTQQANVSSAAASTQQNANSQPSPVQNSQARGNTATHPTTATQTRSTARPHVHLSPALQGLRSNNFDPFLPCNSHHIRPTRVARERFVQSQSAGSANNRNETARVVPIPATSSISISLGAEPVINVNQQSSRGSGSQPTVQPSLPPELQALFQTMRSPNALFGGQNPTTLAQLLQNVPGYSYTAGESIFTDIFMTLAQSLSFLDMVQLGLGSSECLVRARPQLRQLISQRLLNNEPLTNPAITQLINRFNSELRPYYSILSNARLRDEIDVPASINLYNHTLLPTIIHTVMDEDQSTFHRTLMRKCAQYVRQLCAILQYCCLDGVTGLEGILRTFVNQATTGVPGVLQEWTMSHSIVNFRTFVSSLDVPLEDIQSYLVYRVGNAMSSPLPAPTPPHIPPAAEPMDTHDIEEVEIESTPSFMREPPIADVPPTQHINEMVGWQNELPSEWVPVITRDVQRQRRQSPQGPFSDAYLSSMPSKRRKLITSAKPQGNISQVITETMATALSAAGMSSSPEVDVIAQRAGQDSTLRAAYREQVRTTVQNSLNSNPDYLPEKYPNTARYFKKE